MVMEKRIDVIATAIKGGLTVEDLTNVELCYAPPYSSAKDPVNMAGYVATNLVEGELEHIQWHEVDEIIANGGLVIDVREPIEREFGFIQGSINIPLDQLEKSLRRNSSRSNGLCKLSSGLERISSLQEF